MLVEGTRARAGKRLEVHQDHRMPEKLEPNPHQYLTTGTMIAGRYEIVAPLAKGGMGMVYKARQVALDRIVAIKVLPLPNENEDPTGYQRFEIEAKSSAALSHPNIVSVFDY